MTLPGIYFIVDDDYSIFSSLKISLDNGRSLSKLKRNPEKQVSRKRTEEYTNANYFENINTLSAKIQSFVPIPSLGASNHFADQS
jgi:hypothetical protein